jgi:trehalose 6-phosphate phosphatase
LGELRALRDDPSHSGILTDFDGTVSRIVVDPAEARPVDGVPEQLADLARRYATVAVVSGRPVAFLEQYFSDEVVLSGLYGLEVVHGGTRTEHPDAEAWREVIDDVTAVARVSGPDGMDVEAKGLSLTLHYRRRPELESAVFTFGQREAERSGLVLRAARRSVELHPPIEADKGTAVRALTAGLRAVAFLGDDAGDIAAFRALDELGAGGVETVRIAVRSDEAPPGLLESADLVVDGPDGALDLLAGL